MVIDLKIIRDTKKYHKKIKKAIKKYGYCADHNPMSYVYIENSKDKNVVFDLGKGRMILANVDHKNNWILFPCGVLAEKNERYPFLVKFLDYILKKKSDKVEVEVDEDLRKEIVKKFSVKKKYQARTPDILYWPVFNLSNWNSRLRGKKWKKLRNIKNRFYKNHKIRAKESKSVDKEKIRSIVFSWLKRRSNSDVVDKEYYLNMIDNNFKGFDHTRTLIIDGKPCTITAGWRIPNSKCYYSSIGLFDYSYKNLGDIANMDDLNNLKRNGIKHVDFGGSNKSLLKFKKKFKPERIYKTYSFYIARR